MDAGARGCQITIAGKLTGLRHRTEKFLSGHIKFCGETALELMDVGIAQAKLKPGTIGVKVAIMKPNARLPDEIEVVKPEIPVAEEEVTSEENQEETKEEAPEKETENKEDTKKTEQKDEEKKEAKK
tara:strand:- start:1504 stop:1884 length:381 start_codon:yes stop_codon:yes gene_type:complete